jgi:glutamate decarboxylase
VVYEKEEEDVAALGSTVNIADASVYPSSIFIHDRVVDWIARLWHCPEPKAVMDLTAQQPNHFSGSGTVGSTEACLLAGLAHKFRWRRWYATYHNMTDEQVLGVRPNLIISSVFQAAWEKFFRYFDVEPRFVKPSIKNFQIIPEDIYDLCDDKTLAVVGILGNHYNGAYDPIHEMDKVIAKINKEKGFQIGIHVDAASGGFVAPFQDNMPLFDFRLDNVLSISASGHKFGESICGTGWVVFRQREDLTEHIAISVSYLGGQCDSITLNFSRPASGCYVQYYKLLRLGKEGYRDKVDNQMKVAAFLRKNLKEMKRPDGQPRFEILDTGDHLCLPVVGARLNNADGKLKYDDIDFQHALAER